MNFWRTFIKKYHVVSLVQLELRSMIKSNGIYAVNGVYYFFIFFITFICICICKRDTHIAKS